MSVTTMTPAAAPSRGGTTASTSERAGRGRAARRSTPRSRHGDWEPRGRKDPLAILVEQEESRVPELIAIRHGRMAASPFAFYRGAAAVMAADLAAEPSTGLEVQLCGDAHLLNFGGFADPGRRMVFDVNDFDETHPGPFEWDVKRLAASIEVATRARELEDRVRVAAVLGTVAAYRRAMREFADMRVLDIWYSRLDLETIQHRWGAAVDPVAMRNVRRATAKAQSKDHLKAFAKLTRPVDGEARFLSDPPLLEPISEVFSGIDVQRMRETLLSSIRTYRRALPRSRQHLFDRYRFVDLARKVVGVGSVGTRCWVALLLGRDGGDPLFLQVKQAEPSVLEAYTARSRFHNHGQRVVEGQELMQAASDIFLGWTRTEGPDGVSRDFYMRQLWDWKLSADIETMREDVLGVYGQLCAWTLARAHARSGDPVAIASYLGSGDAFDRSVARFAAAYADQNERDHAALVQAINEGRLEATSGV